MQVDWNETALDQLASIYLVSPPEMRDEITRASDEIEKRLSRNGVNEGESRAGIIRILFHDFLIIDFAIQPTGTIEILKVRPNRPARG